MNNEASLSNLNAVQKRSTGAAPVWPFLQGWPALRHVDQRRRLIFSNRQFNGVQVDCSQFPGKNPHYD
jgi:hypothetical protein